ncbi:hypothetical protein E2C01_093254 [Portunus trituberculatus]|uniref:Uncharacterized protein n=1 Tax=Portunus trituberculatus TaxID=210409 RepID=A0A5B7JII8_PORTR|nr:hypothetical protein [Portunus trituberculatus]
MQNAIIPPSLDTLTPRQSAGGAAHTITSGPLCTPDSGGRPPAGSSRHGNGLTTEGWIAGSHAAIRAIFQVILRLPQYFYTIIIKCSEDC